MMYSSKTSWKKRWRRSNDATCHTSASISHVNRRQLTERKSTTSLMKNKKEYPPAQAPASGYQSQQVAIKSFGLPSLLRKSTRLSSLHIMPSNQQMTLPIVTPSSGTCIIWKMMMKTDQSSCTKRKTSPRLGITAGSGKSGR